MPELKVAHQSPDGWKRQRAPRLDLALSRPARTILCPIHSGGNIMKAFFAAVICAAVIGIVASYVLHTQQQTVDVAFATSGARVGNPGHNLIGTD
jgi:hypothetical protein